MEVNIEEELFTQNGLSNFTAFEARKMGNDDLLTLTTPVKEVLQKVKDTLKNNKEAKSVTVQHGQYGLCFSDRLRLERRGFKLKPISLEKIVVSW